MGKVDGKDVRKVLDHPETSATHLGAGQLSNKLITTEFSTT